MPPDREMTMSVTHLRDSLRELLPVENAELVRLFAERRQESAFAELVRRHGPAVMNVCRSLLGRDDADDAFQETFAALARRAGSLSNPAAVLGWLCGTARRTSLALGRASARRRRRERGRQTPSPSEPADELTWREVRVAVAEEVNRLPAKFRDAFTLCVEQSHSREEASAELGVPVGTVNSRLHEAKSRLRERLSRRGIDLSAVLAAASLSAHVGAITPGLLCAA